jgi:hypothetical protein
MRHDPIDPARSDGPERPAIPIGEQSLDAWRREVDTPKRRTLTITIVEASPVDVEEREPEASA